MCGIAGIIRKNKNSEPIDIKSLEERLFSSTSLLDQPYFLLLRSLKLGNFPVIMLYFNFKMRQMYYTNI